MLKQKLVSTRMVIINNDYSNPYDKSSDNKTKIIESTKNNQSTNNVCGNKDNNNINCKKINNKHNDHISNNNN